MDESRLTTIPQVEDFLSASASIDFKPGAGDFERYAHISTVLKRFDYPRRNKRERGVLPAYLRHTSGYSPAPSSLVWSRAGNPTAWLRSHWPSATVRRQPPLRASTPPATWRCWWRWSAPTRMCVAQPSCISCAEPFRSMVMRAMSACLSCPSPTCTTCAKARATRPAG